jgi:hypothetical protein
VARTLGDVPGMTPEERWRIATDADDLIATAAVSPGRVVPGRLASPPAHARTARRVGGVAQVVLGTTFAGLVFVQSSGSTLSAMMNIMIILGAGGFAIGATLLAARFAWLPYAWVILRERGVDACLHCGTIGGSPVDRATQCPECGATNPAARSPAAPDPPAPHDP